MKRTTKTHNRIASAPRQGARGHRRCSGYVTLTVLFCLVAFAVVMASLASLTKTQLHNSRQGLMRAKALSLAEAGVEDAVQRMNTNVAYAGTGSNAITLYESDNVPFGTFRTTVTPVDAWTRKVVSEGVSVDNQAMNLTAIMAIKKEKLGSSSAAIRSNGIVHINGTADIVTVPAGKHSAHIMANGDITVGGSSLVDGTLSSYTNIFGIGTALNAKLNIPLRFLTEEMATQMKGEWVDAARAGGVLNASITGSTVITGSKYIRGNIKLTGLDTVILAGTGNSVVYVDGDVELSGGVLINGVTLIVKGTFTQAGSSVYKVVPGLPSPALFVYNEAGEPVGVKLAGGGILDEQGIVYSLKGDVNLVGGSTITGAIYNADASAGVKATGNITLRYPLNLQSSIDEPGDTFVTHVLEL